MRVTIYAVSSPLRSSTSFSSPVLPSDAPFGPYRVGALDHLIHDNVPELTQNRLL
jgi:hypothetical protein